jgi:hypothetical protein
MSLLPGIPIPLVERISPQTGVRRVERDQNAENFHRRHHQEDDTNGQDEEESPHDVVEVSGDYHPSELPVSDSCSPMPLTLAVSSSSALERHIDITG